MCCLFYIIAIMAKIIRKSSWAKVEITYLKKYYPKMGAEHVAEKLNRTQNAVRAMVQSHKLSSNRRKEWTEWEDRFLKKHYHEKSCASLGRSLKRSETSISHRAYRLNLTNDPSRKWLPKEVDLFVKLYPYRKKSLEELSVIFKRSMSALMAKARKMGLRRPRHDNAWTQEQHTYLVKNIKKKSYKEIAEYLGLDCKVVVNHAINFHIQKPHRFRKMTQEEKDYIIKYYHKKPAREIGEKFGRTVGAIRTYAGTLGVTIKKKTRSK